MSSFPVLSPVSTSRPKWQFDEKAPASAGYFCESFEGYRLEGRILSNDEGVLPSWPNLLAIHGARSDYTKLNPLLYSLQTHGVASLSFHLSGHNEASALDIERTSLENNLKESLRFASILGAGLNALFGHSMGGALALKVAETYHSSVKKIILSCPAIYSEIAYHRPFGSSFRHEISTPFSYINSLSLKFLREFKGDLMLIIGQYDGLKSIEFGGIAGTAAGMVSMENNKSKIKIVNSAIPFEVIDAIENSLPPSRFCKVILPECDHAVSAWLRANPMFTSDLANDIANFLNC